MSYKYFLVILAFASFGCGKNDSQQNIATAPITPAVTCVPGQNCAPGAYLPLNPSVHFSGVVTLDGKDSTKKLIKDMVSYSSGFQFCLFGCGSGADYNHGFLDLRAKANPNAQGQVDYIVMLALGRSSYYEYDSYYPRSATINSESPLFAIAGGTGSQLLISPGSAYGYPGFGNYGGGNISGHKFTIQSSASLDGSTPLIPNVQIIIDDQYPTPPSIPFGLVTLTQQLY